jgi:threonylcarbamoyladenosine tRNA methylthiotransferase MtaB
MPLRVAFHTLGCKLNQLETESLANAFALHGAVVLPFGGEGLVRDGDGAWGTVDLVVVNTCTVTGKAEQKARRIVRLALSADPCPAVLVTGCYAQVEATALSALGDRVLVLPGQKKEALLGLPDYLAARGVACADYDSGADLLDSLRSWLTGPVFSSPGGGAFAFNPDYFAFHSRPSLKIQDGCDNDCAYCRVHIARGPSVSLSAGEALERSRVLEAAGSSEIVLTGVNLSQYRDGITDFPGLLRMLLTGTRRISFRLSSYEPDKIDSAFLEVFAHPRIRPHVHLAVQSGADPVLARMGRSYGHADVLGAVRTLRSVRHDPFIAADLIAGFPGETEADAAATRDFACECDFAWIHAFRFSPRPGTMAVSMPGHIPERVAGERVDALLEIGRSGRSSYIARWAGRELKAVLESDLCATSENYLKLKVSGLPETARPGQEILCRIEASLPAGIDCDIDSFSLYTGPAEVSQP